MQSIQRHFWNLCTFISPQITFIQLQSLREEVATPEGRPTDVGWVARSEVNAISFVKSLPKLRVWDQSVEAVISNEPSQKYNAPTKKLHDQRRSREQANIYRDVLKCRDNYYSKSIWKITVPVIVSLLSSLMKTSLALAIFS